MMEWGWLLLALLFVCLAAVAASSITVDLAYSRIKSDDNFHAHIKGLYGLARYKIQVPVMEFEGDSGVLVKEERVNENADKLVEEHTEQIDKQKLSDYFRRMQKAAQYTFRLNHWIVESLSRISCTELTWRTQLGLGEAPHTALATGAVWTLKSVILTFIFHYIRRRTRPSIQVNPAYNQVLFSTQFSCIVKIRLGHAMLAGLFLLIRILKVKGGIKAWRSILSKG